jgi:hypothetical protein
MAPVNRKQLQAFSALSDHLTNNRKDYYKIPESKIQELSTIYNKDRIIVLSWDDRHHKFDVNCLNTEVDPKVMERILKLSKIFGREDLTSDRNENE